MSWPVAEAKNKFSEVMTRALTEGPQTVTRRNEAVVVVAKSEFDQLQSDDDEFFQHLLNIPKSDEPLDIPSRNSFGRDIDIPE